VRARRDLSAQWTFFGVKPWQLRLLLLQWADDLPVMSEPNSRHCSTSKRAIWICLIGARSAPMTAWFNESSSVDGWAMTLSGTRECRMTSSRSNATLASAYVV
jgi:hypothetical protein